MKYALIIGNNKYDDPKLAQLKTPAADSAALAKVLDDKSIGAFDEVTSLVNQSETNVRRTVSAFLTDKKPDDLVLLYFSGHGVLDDRGRLYLALKDTQVNLLKATSIPSSFVADEMDSCRSRRQILVLDCCHSGAFARGTKGAEAQKAITETTFEGSGFGRVVLTASDSTQYALEGDQVIKQTELSLFTHFLLEGLKTGEADMNNDGHISLDEWYDYTYTKVVAETPRQVPHKWSYNQQGDLLIARNPFLKKNAAELPYELIQALESPFVGIRESAVIEVGKYLKSRDSEIVNLAVASLEKMKNDDSRRISSLAEKLLSEFEQTRSSRMEILHPKPPVEIERNAIDAQTESTKEAQRLPPSTKKVKSLVDKPIAHKPGLDQTVWSKWIGTAVVAFLAGTIVYYYVRQIADTLDLLGILFCVVAGLTGLIQFSLFRERLQIWWIGVNGAAGFVLGFLHKYLQDFVAEWHTEDLGLLLAIWLIGNLVVGFILIQKAQQGAKQVTALLETGAQQNIFLLALSIFLAFDALATLMIILDDKGIVGVPISLQNVTLALTGIISLLAGISYFRAKDTPRNFGFSALIAFLFLNGIFVEILVVNADTALYYFIFLVGMISLFSGAFFVFQKELWKNFSFLMLSGYLLSTGIGGITFGIASINVIFFAISSLFAIPAAISFFLRK